MHGARAGGHFIAGGRFATTGAVCFPDGIAGAPSRLYLFERFQPWQARSRRGTLGGARMSLNHVTLDDKYDLTKSRVFVTGYQALVRLTLMQKELDRRAGLNTAGYVTGYRGSPLGGLDYQFQRVAALLQKNDVVFHPGINEDLAATALWGVAAGRASRRGQIRRGVRHLVRQGAGRRPHRRRVPPCQLCRHVQARRRARPDGRRPHCGILHHRTPVRVSLRRCDDPDPEPGRRSGDSGLRSLRLRHVALLRRLDGVEMHA